MEYITIEQVRALHRLALEQSGGSDGERDTGALQSAITQPMGSFGGVKFYPTLEEKAAALAYGLAMNHPFIDGNKRVAYFAMETVLSANGYEIQATIDDAERMMLDVAAGKAGRDALVDWLRKHIVKSS